MYKIITDEMTGVDVAVFTINGKDYKLPLHNIGANIQNIDILLNIVARDNQYPDFTKLKEVGFKRNISHKAAFWTKKFGDYEFSYVECNSIFVLLYDGSVLESNTMNVDCAIKFVGDFEALMKRFSRYAK